MTDTLGQQMILGFRRMAGHTQLQRLVDAAIRIGEIDFEHVDGGAERHGSPCGKPAL
jgi:hypothetical protein